MPARPASRTAVLVFARTPHPGHVKRRLIPALGPEGAARLHARMAARAVHTAVEAAVGPVTVCCTPTTDHPLFESLVESLGRIHPLRLETQIGPDLGARMLHALDSALQRWPAALIVGSDCPSMSADDLREAAASLDAGAEVVLGPATDGGYWLLGLRQPVPALFEDVPWGSEGVADVTRARLRASVANWRELGVRPDVDRPEDLAALPAGLLDGPWTQSIR